MDRNVRETFSFFPPCYLSLSTYSTPYDSPEQTNIRSKKKQFSCFEISKMDFRFICCDNSLLKGKTDQRPSSLLLADNSAGLNCAALFSFLTNWW